MRPSPDPMLFPWPARRPWLILLAGVALGGWIGYSPTLFVAMGVLCLLCGWFRRP